MFQTLYLLNRQFNRVMFRYKSRDTLYEVFYYDGGYYLSPVTYKELRLPNANSTYTKRLVRVSAVQNATYNGQRVEWLIHWEYVYDITA